MQNAAALVFCVLVGLACGCTNELVSHRGDGGAEDAASAIDAARDAVIGADSAEVRDTASAPDVFVAPDAFVVVDANAAVLNAPLPRGFGCTARTTTVVTMLNTGTTTWAGDAGDALVSVDAADPLAQGVVRVPLAAGETVAPGAMRDFAVVLGATGVAAGVHTTRWQMARGAAAFGATVSGDITVYACETISPPTIDLASVTIVGSPDVRGFSRTSTLTSIAFHPSIASWHIDHTLRGTWPPIVIDPTDGTTQEATIWIFFRIGGAWYATGGERLRPSQADKGIPNPSQLGPDWLYDMGRWGIMAGYVPSPGDLVGFMIAAGSTRADDSVMVMERTGVVLIAFPADDVDSSFSPPFAWTE